VVAFAARRVKKRAINAVISRLVLLSLVLGFWLGNAQPLRTEEPILPRPFNPARARVVIVEEPRSVMAFTPVAEVVEQMVNRGVVALTGKDSLGAAWRSLVSTQETVGLKVFSAPGGTSGTRPAVVAAVVKGLLAAGLPPAQVVIWDKHLTDLRQAGYVDLGQQLGVSVAGSADEGYDPKCSYETALLGKLVWGDYEFGKQSEDLGRKSFVSKLLTQRLTKIINIAPLLNHNLAQVSGLLYSITFGSVDNSLRFETAPNPIAQLREAIPELYALPEIGDRVVLNIVDALICQYQGEERGLLHYSTMLNQLRFSTDPVALDVLSIRELERQRQLAKIPPVRVNWQIYTNAALLDLGVSDTRLMDLIKVNASGGPD
jgi:hypothetical protein